MAVDPCNATGLPTLLNTSFAPGASTAFASAAHWEAPPSAVDTNYPGLFVAEAAGVNTGGGPSGENYLTLHTSAAADDWPIAAAAWRGLGSVNVFGAGASVANAWDATRGYLTLSQRLTSASLSWAYYHLPFQLSGVTGDGIQLACYYVGARLGTDVEFELQYGVGPYATFTTPVTVQVAKADLIAEGWRTWTVCWQCGTYNWPGGVADPVVASDGWLKILRGSVVMFDLQDIPLSVSDGAYLAAGSDYGNHARLFALGYYGLVGDVTNVHLRSGPTP